MSTFDNTDSHDDQGIDVFSDPVAYLAAHGIDASLIADTTLPAAA